MAKYLSTTLNQFLLLSNDCKDKIKHPDTTNCTGIYFLEITRVTNQIYVIDLIWGIQMRDALSHHRKKSESQKHENWNRTT